jgi:hypothetical protein
MFSRRVLSLAALTFFPLPAYGAETLWNEITVRVYDSTGAGAAERRAALAIAASIVSVASVELIWRTCTGPASPAASPSQRSGPCEKPLADGELALRIIRSRAADGTSREPLPLGEALIDAHAGSGVLATIFIDRVDAMAAQTGDSRDSLLGRAIAHELGHLLMTTSAHSAHGLMRPVWTKSEIRRHSRTDWTFRPTEIAAIKAHTATGRKTETPSADARLAAPVDELALLRLDSVAESAWPAR